MKFNILFIAYARFKNIKRNLSTLSSDHFEKIFIFIDGTNNSEIKSTQQDFYTEYNNKFYIRKHEKNYGVRKFIPYAISECFKKSEILIVIEDDILINNLSIKFLKQNKNFLDSHMISLFNPNDFDYSLINFDGGIWGWCISKKLWYNFNFTKHSLFLIFYNVLKTNGLLKSIYFSPLVYMSANNKIKSWAYAWYYNRLCNKILSITPSASLSSNVGFTDKFSTNTKRRSKLSSVKISKRYSNKKIEKSIGLNKLLSISFFQILIRVLYNWIRLVIYRF